MSKVKENALHLFSPLVQDVLADIYLLMAKNAQELIKEDESSLFVRCMAKYNADKNRESLIALIASLVYLVYNTDRLPNEPRKENAYKLALSLSADGMDQGLANFKAGEAYGLSASEVAQAMNNVKARFKDRAKLAGFEFPIFRGEG